MYHQPVLLHESIDLLDIQPDGTYIDVTFGGGGHSREILRRLGEKGRLIAFDRDADARENVISTKLNDQVDDRLTLIASDFKFIEKEIKNRNIGQIDGILADFGVSSHQFDTAERGFSFRFDAPLDMRMDTSSDFSAANILNEYEYEEMEKMFRQYGEVPNSRKLSNAILNLRKTEEIKTTFQFEKMIEADCIPKKDRHKYLAQVYQALRIEVNGELDSLRALLEGAVNLLKPGGRMVTIAYHSLEDRLVKHHFRSGNFEDKLEKDFFGNPITPWEILIKRPIEPSEAEIVENPRARSAKLRAAKKLKIEN